MQQLLFGAMLFKIGLIVIGLWAILLSRIPIWKSTAKVEGSLLKGSHPLNLVILAVILLVASALRLYGLNTGLWYDEILTYVNYVKLPFGQIVTTYDDQNQHFLYTLLAHASFQIFGESAWSLRLPAVLFGVGSIWALYLLGHQVTDTREALLSTALLTFSYHHIWFSQNARGYTGLLFWTLVSSLLFLRGIREARPQLWLLYAAVAALGVYTHLTMLFVIAGHLVVYLITLLNRRSEIWPNRWSDFFLGFCLAGTLTFQLYALVLPQMFGGTLSQGAERSIAVTAWKNPLWTLTEFVRGMEISLDSGIAVTVVLVIFGAGFLSLKREDPIFILLMVIPVLIGGAAAKAMGHPLWPRLFFFSIGFGVLIVVRGTMFLVERTANLFQFEPKKSTAVGTILCIGLISISSMSVPSVYAPKQDYLGALTYVQERYQPGDMIVTVGIVATFPYKSLYKTDWEAVETLQDLNSVRSRARRTWLLYTMPLHVQSAYPEIMASIQRDFKIVKQFYGTLGGGTIFVCQSDTLL